MIKRPNWDSHEWATPQRRARPPTLREVERQLLGIFHYLVHRYGLEKARQVFANFVTVPSRTQQKNFEMLDMLQDLDSMEPKPNVKRFVRELLAEQGIGPDHPTFQAKRAALEKKIRNWKKKRWPGIQAQFGAVSPPAADDEPVKFVFQKKKKRTFRR